MSPLFLLVLSGITGGVAQTLRKLVTGKNHRATTIVTAFWLTNAVFSLPLFLSDPVYPDDPLIWFVAVLSAAAFAVASAFLMKAYALSDLSTMTVIQRLSIIITALFGVIVLGEVLSLAGAIGILLLFFGAAVTLIENRRLDLNSGVVFSLLSALIGSLAAILDKIALNGFSPFTYVFINNLLIGLTFLLRRNIIPETVLLIRSHPVTVLLSSLLGVFTFAVLLTVLKLQPVSLVLPVYKTVSFFIPVILGIVFFGEKSNLKNKIIGSALAVAGIILLS